MRIAGVIAVSALVAACSQSVGGEAEPSRPAAGTAADQRRRRRPSRPAEPPGAPAPGASIDEVIAWIEAGHPPTRAAFTSPSRDGVDHSARRRHRVHRPVRVAARHHPVHHRPAGRADVPARAHAPAPAPGAGRGHVEAGLDRLFRDRPCQSASLRGDPGPFVNGPGTELAAGQSLDVRRQPLPQRRVRPVLCQLRASVGGPDRADGVPAVRLSAARAPATGDRRGVQLLSARESQPGSRGLAGRSPGSWPDRSVSCRRPRR